MKTLRAFLVALAAPLFFTAVLAAQSRDISGRVRDTGGGAIAGAEVLVLTPERSTVASARTDETGAFKVAAGPGPYVLIVRAPGFTEKRVAIQTGKSYSDLDVRLDLMSFGEDVTVTAARNAAEATWRSPQSVNIVTPTDITERVTTVVAQAVEGEEGVALQRTSPTMAGVFVRGLTGNKVNVFVDGVRYSNGAQRGGVNTFLDLIEPGWLESIEILRGPSSAEYGSDALGGSVQFQSVVPSLGITGGPRFGGAVQIDGGTAHRYGGGSARVSFMGPALGVTASLGGRNTGLLRTGGGIDSHAAVTRFFGIPSSELMDARLPDTGFQQWGGSLKANWTANSRTQVVASYMATRQDKGKRYDQLLGGDGNLIAELNDLTLDLFYARVERQGLGWFENGSLTYSLNSQREERVNQGGNGSNTATIGHEPERTTAHGLSGIASRALSPRASLSLGGDVYLERLTSEAFNVNAVTGAQTPRRPRVPDGATFAQGGIFARTSVELMPALTGSASVRFGSARYRANASDSPLVNNAPLWPDDRLTANGLTFRAGLVATPNEAWSFALNVSRGFRAPHMTDLGTLGLTGSGFEVAAPDVAGLGGRVGSTADNLAVSTGVEVKQLEPETSLEYEGSIRYRNRYLRTSLTGFINTIGGNIQKQALILPDGAVGLAIGGQVITSQTPNGVVFVPASTVPVLVRANFDEARVWGIEHSAELRLGQSAALTSAYTYLRARDLTTDLPPNIEGGTPAPNLWLTFRWSPAGSRWWVAPYVHHAWKQTHLSSLDLGDRRIGAGRSRSSIQAFFRNGARNRGWIDAGPDGAFNTADDLLIATGETLAEVQNRVLGTANSSPLFPVIPGYTVAGLRAGIRLGKHELQIDAENLTDENYRGLSWGVDAPGRGINVKFIARF